MKPNLETVKANAGEVVKELAGAGFDGKAQVDTKNLGTTSYTDIHIDERRPSPLGQFIGYRGNHKSIDITAFSDRPDHVDVKVSEPAPSGGPDVTISRNMDGKIVSTFMKPDGLGADQRPASQQEQKDFTRAENAAKTIYAGSAPKM